MYKTNAGKPCTKTGMEENVYWKTKETMVTKNFGAGKGFNLIRDVIMTMIMSTPDTESLNSLGTSS
jgi:hypothetical protein